MRAINLPGGVVVWTVSALVLMPVGVCAQQAGPPVRISWTSDVVSVRQGDIVTILIDEFMMARADRNEANTTARGRDVSLRAGSGAGFGGSLRTGNEASNSVRGESSRTQRFSAEMSARIVEIMPNGIARIEGRKTIQIDDHEQEVVVRGLVRTQDISVANTIESWRVADAELLYNSNGKLGSAGGGIWSKLLDLIIP